MANVNRWRGQLGLLEIGGAELEKLKEKIKVGDLDATLVDLVEQRPTGPDDSTPRPGLGAGKLPFGHAAPKSWKARRPFSPQLAVWAIEGKGGAVEVSVTPLRGTGGPLLPNLNRWRRQIGLGPVGREGLQKDVGSLEIGEDNLSYVDISGPGRKGPERMLVVILPRDGQTWFFKAKGPPALVKEHKAAFEKFVRSVKFDGGQGAADE